MTLSASLLNSASNPARNPILNIVAGTKLQFAISLSTGIGSIASIAATKIVGELDTQGLENVLYLQAPMFVLGAFFVARLSPAPPQNARRPTIHTIRDGLTHVWKFKLARDLIGLNCLSTFFNAGA